MFQRQCRSVKAFLKEETQSEKGKPKKKRTHTHKRGAIAQSRKLTQQDFQSSEEEHQKKKKSQRAQARKVKQE